MRHFLILLIFLFIVIGGLNCRGNPSPMVSPMAFPTQVKMVFTSPLVNLLPDVKEMVLFISLREGHPEVYAVSPDGAKTFRVLELPEPYQVIGHLDWSSTRKQIAFALAYGERIDVFKADLMTTVLENITDETPFGGIEPRWSHNGTQIAYVCGEYEPDICIIGADGSGYIQLTTHPSRDINPSWSPDGLAIAYQTNRGGLADIYIINLKDMRERSVTQGVSQNAQPFWSPDGKAILFQSDRDGSMDIFTISPEGERIANLTRSNALDVDPQWSPSGEFIAFRSNRDGEWDLFVMKRDGSKLVNLTYSWGPVFTYAWSTDNRYLVFASTRDGNSNIYRVDITSGEIVQLTHHPAEDMSPLWVSLGD